MHYNEMLVKLTYLTQLNNIAQSDIGKCINRDRFAMNKRAKTNFKFPDEEIKNIEKAFNISFSDALIYTNSLKRQFDENIFEKTKNIGERINQIQFKNSLSDEQMAVLLNISNEEYLNIKQSKIIPDTTILSNIKQNFQVSIDWLLYGE